MAIHPMSKKDEKKIQNLPIIGKKITDEKEEKFLREICTYEFYNQEEPGLAHSFSYGDPRNKYDFTFFHGGRYRVPRFIAQHLESCSTPIWSWRPDGTGGMRKEKTGTKSRFQMRQVYE